MAGVAGIARDWLLSSSESDSNSDSDMPQDFLADRSLFVDRAPRPSRPGHALLAGREGTDDVTLDALYSDDAGDADTREEEEEEQLLGEFTALAPTAFIC